MAKLLAKRPLARFGDDDSDEPDDGSDIEKGENVENHDAVDSGGVVG